VVQNSVTYFMDGPIEILAAKGTAIVTADRHWSSEVDHTCRPRGECFKMLRVSKTLP